MVVNISESLSISNDFIKFVNIISKALVKELELIVESL